MPKSGKQTAFSALSIDDYETELMSNGSLLETDILEEYLPATVQSNGSKKHTYASSKTNGTADLQAQSVGSAAARLLSSAQTGSGRMGSGQVGSGRTGSARSALGTAGRKGSAVRTLGPVEILELISEQLPAVGETDLPTVSLDQKVANLASAVCSFGQQLDMLSRKLYAHEEKNYQDLAHVLELLKQTQDSINPLIPEGQQQLVVRQRMQ